MRSSSMSCSSAAASLALLVPLAAAGAGSRVLARRRRLLLPLRWGAEGGHHDSPTHTPNTSTPPARSPLHCNLSESAPFVLVSSSARALTAPPARECHRLPASESISFGMRAC
ncbi:hypothetical protein C8F04DRAFT_1142629 [Mycena alexandri]|uniref:Uncharacterized protein n=1 Tax=Mycena alexandri TaxID=1745969 RepID=A0AAD6WPY1_9AGAR|nr:hypothetical protein C8F04DRAFT_1142629 [Mycena alexandri]